MNHTKLKHWFWYLHIKFGLIMWQKYFVFFGFVKFEKYLRWAVSPQSRKHYRLGACERSGILPDREGWIKLVALWEIKKSEYIILSVFVIVPLLTWTYL